MFKKTAPVLLLGSALLAVSVAAVAQDGSKGGTNKVVPTQAASGNMSPASLIERYKEVAGSEANAKSLVNGLHSGDPITLIGPPPPPPLKSALLKPGLKPPLAQPVTVTFTPPTGNMGLGNVDIALTLMEAVVSHSTLKKASPTHLFAILMSDPGILQMRAGGMGWGAIAKELGFELK